MKNPAEMFITSGHSTEWIMTTSRVSLPIPKNKMKTGRSAIPGRGCITADSIPKSLSRGAYLNDSDEIRKARTDPAAIPEKTNPRDTPTLTARRPPLNSEKRAAKTRLAGGRIRSETSPDRAVNSQMPRRTANQASEPARVLSLIR